MLWRRKMRTDAIDWLGILATEEEIKNKIGKSNCFLNSKDTLQFYLKVISKMPGQSVETQYIVCYSNHLDNEKIRDNQAHDDNLRIKDYVSQLKNYFFRFNYEKKKDGYLRAKNIAIVELNENYYDGKNFTIIPMIRSKSPVFPMDRTYNTYEELELAIKNGEYISKLNKYNTLGLENIPYIIFNDPEIPELRVIGNFVSFKFETNG